MQTPDGIRFLLSALATIPEYHPRTSPLYKVLDDLVRASITRLLGPASEGSISLEPLGHITLPYTEMGAINSTHLFGLDEMIIFAFYTHNRWLYRRVVDAGANIGLHSIVLSRCGFDVRSYEPDPNHFEQLQRNLQRNHCTSVAAIPAALSTATGVREFIRVIDNTTGSHLAGSKSGIYGPTVTFSVQAQAFSRVIADADLVKVDVEGHEADILCSVPLEQWTHTDAIVEVGSINNAQAIYSYFAKSEIRLFAQKLGWRRVTGIAEMPSSYKEGSLFISAKPQMPWPDSA